MFLAWVSLLTTSLHLAEGRGSLHCFLKAKGWATSLSAGVGDEGMHRSSVAYIFGMSIHLTDSGLGKVLSLYLLLTNVLDSRIQLDYPTYCVFFFVVWSFLLKAKTIYKILFPSINFEVILLMQLITCSSQAFFFNLYFLKSWDL